MGKVIRKRLFGKDYLEKIIWERIFGKDYLGKNYLGKHNLEKIIWLVNWNSESNFQEIFGTILENAIYPKFVKLTPLQCIF